MSFNESVEVDVHIHDQPTLKRTPLYPQLRRTFWHQDISTSRRSQAALTTVSSPLFPITVFFAATSTNNPTFPPPPFFFIPQTHTIRFANSEMTDHNKMQSPQVSEGRPYPALIFRAVTGEKTPGASKFKTRWCVVDTQNGVGELVQSVVSTVNYLEIFKTFTKY